MAAIPTLVCLTVVANLEGGSIARNDCHFEPSQTVIEQQSSASTAISLPPQHKELEAIAAVEPLAKKAEARPLIRKIDLHKARPGQIRIIIIPAASHVVTAEQNRAFRYSWFDRISAGLAKPGK